MLTSRSIATACLAATAMLLAPSGFAGEGARPDKVSFYFAAHQDDWQLFMNPSAFEDVTNGAAKTVFIHMTAGDAGLGTGVGGRKHPFYLRARKRLRDCDPLHGRCRRCSGRTPRSSA